MDKDQKFWLVIFGLVATILMVLIISLAINDYNVKKLMVEKGYQQETIIGYNAPVWRKVIDK